MNIFEAIDRNLAFKTEYGGGARVLGGLLARRVLKRKRYRAGGGTREDTVHERTLTLGPLYLEHRSLKPELIGNDDYEFCVSLFGIFGTSNDKDYWIRLQLGPSMGMLRTLAPATPAAAVGSIADADLTARAGLRFNVSGFIRDLRGEEADPDSSDHPLWDDDSRSRSTDIQDG